MSIKFRSDGPIEIWVDICLVRMVVLKLKYGKNYYPWFVNFSFARCTQSYLLSSNKHDKNILSLISMCYDMRYYWRHPEKIFNNHIYMRILSRNQLLIAILFLHLKICLRCDFALRNPFLAKNNGFLFASPILGFSNDVILL